MSTIFKTLFISSPLIPLIVRSSLSISFFLLLQRTQFSIFPKAALLVISLQNGFWLPLQLNNQLGSDILPWIPCHQSEYHLLINARQPYNSHKCFRCEHSNNAFLLSFSLSLSRSLSFCTQTNPNCREKEKNISTIASRCRWFAKLYIWNVFGWNVCDWMNFSPSITIYFIATCYWIGPTPTGWFRKYVTHIRVLPESFRIHK